ncbi:MAG: HDOD domain-containing protein [Kiritimatiellae bacterium]|nr:HDOD domain-containing protein [Kiritimatiellia bacterium]
MLHFSAGGPDTLDADQRRQIEEQLRRELKSKFEAEKKRRDAEAAQAREVQEEALRREMKQKLMAEMAKEYGFNLADGQGASASAPAAEPPPVAMPVAEPPAAAVPVGEVRAAPAKGPVAAPAAEKRPAAARPGPARRQAAARAPAPVLRPPVILVADASVETVKIIRRVAQGEGCQTQVVQGGDLRALVEALAEQKPYVLFLNTLGGAINPLPVCRRARGLDVAVVLMGQFPSAEDVLTASKMGAVGILVEPLTPETVGPKIISALAFAKEVLKRELTFRRVDAGTESMQEKVERVMAEAAEVMAFPHTASRIVEICNRPDVEAEELARVAETDAAISSMMLKRANSAAYAGSSRVETVRDAIVRLGYRMIRSTVTIMSVFALSDAEEKSFVFNRLGHWVHSLAVGSLAEALARVLHYRNPEDAFLAGVLHDIGKLVLDDHLHEDYAQAARLVGVKHTSMRDAEQEYFGIPHDAVGHHVALRWRLPEEITEAIAKHHSPAEIAFGGDAGWTIEAFVYAADQMAKVLMLGDSADFYAAQLPAAFWDHVPLDGNLLRPFIHKAFDRVLEHVNWLNMPADRAGLFPFPPANHKGVYVVDGNTPDRLLDLFFCGRGYDVLHSTESPDMPSGPSIIVYDLRQGGGVGPYPAAGAAEARIVALQGETPAPPGALPANARVLPAPLDYVLLLQTIAG